MCSNCGPYDERTWEEDRDDNAHSWKFDDEEEEEEDVCPECEHPWRLHGDIYGCQYEHGDRYVLDVGPVAMGTCGCKREP